MFDSIFKTKKVDEAFIIARNEFSQVQPETIHPKPSLPVYGMEKLETGPTVSRTEEYLQLYEEMSASLGIVSPNLEVEKFKALLTKLDMPIFSLTEVIQYMNEKARKEGKKNGGWEWRPLREKDHLDDFTFGQGPVAEVTRYNGDSFEVTKAAFPASDYYHGKMRSISTQHTRLAKTSDGYLTETVESLGNRSSTMYDRTIPLHALKRVKLIEEHYKGKLGFFVSDYAIPLDAIIQAPDPFLMVVVPNDQLRRGDGRFVIDFWDEPGFGIEQMLKA